MAKKKESQAERSASLREGTAEMRNPLARAKQGTSDGYMVKRAEPTKKWEVKAGTASGKAGYYAAVPHSERDKHKQVGGLGYGDSPTYDAIYKRHGVNPETHKILEWPKHTNPEGGKKWHDSLK